MLGGSQPLADSVMVEQEIASPNAREVQYWNSITTQVWADQHETVDRLFAGLTQVVLELAAPAPGERVIDIGCGSGTTVLELAKYVGPGGYVLGADVSRHFVERARERIAAAGIRNANVLLADVSTHAFQPHSFDLAFSRFGVMFFADPIATFTKLHNAMKTRGRLAFAAFRTAEENSWCTAAFKAVQNLLPLVPPSESKETGQFSWADPARVRRILESAGFQNFSLTPHDPLIELAGPGGAEAAADFAMHVGPIARAAQGVSAQQQKAVRASLKNFFQSHDSPRGIVLPGAIWVVRARA